MRTLHIINKAPDHHRFSRCLAGMAEADQLLLTENAVIAVTLEGVALPAQSYALEPDMAARGVPCNDSVTAIDFDRMVALTSEADRVICW